MKGIDRGQVNTNCLREKLERLYILKMHTQNEGKVYYICSHHKIDKITQAKKGRYRKIWKRDESFHHLPSIKGLVQLPFENVVIQYQKE